MITSCLSYYSSYDAEAQSFPDLYCAHSWSSRLGGFRWIGYMDRILLILWQATWSDWFLLLKKASVVKDYFKLFLVTTIKKVIPSEHIHTKTHLFKVKQIPEITQNTVTCISKRRLYIISYDNSCGRWWKLSKWVQMTEPFIQQENSKIWLSSCSSFSSKKTQLKMTKSNGLHVQILHSLYKISVCP